MSSPVSTVKLNMKSLLLVQHLILKNRKNQQKLQLYFNILLAINSLSFKKIKRYKKQLQKRQKRQVQKHRHQGPRNQGDILSVDIYERTGLFEDTYYQYFEVLKNSIELLRAGMSLNCYLFIYLHTYTHI